jgi:hypothetical protein
MLNLIGRIMVRSLATAIERGLKLFDKLPEPDLTDGESKKVDANMHSVQIYLTIFNK